MTYELPRIGAGGAAAVVPKGAEVMLETRLPYLSEAQRRVVLETTAIASGYPVLDDPEGWGRLNLFAAADGYAVFSGNVTVNMDAADRWRNDISGSGKLVKQGSGTLKLGGKNSWSGGAQVEGGTLRVITAGSLKGKFGAIVVEGYTVTPTYSATGLPLRLGA